jgi:tetratricopeptide (TPR) repeat protein
MNHLKIIQLPSVFFLLMVSLNGGLVFGQTQEPSSTNPLQTDLADPLLPKLDRPLSPLEKSKLEKACDDLNAQALKLFNESEEEEAFKIWYRELRLRRELGQFEEVSALGRVGEFAWQKNRSNDVEIISKRLEAIESQANNQKQLDPNLLNAFGKAYQQIKQFDRALSIYQQILANARQQKNLETQKEALLAIGSLNLARFNYQNAATAYEELLAIATEEENHLERTNYLSKLAEIYNEATQPTNGIKIKLQLAETYLKEQKNRELAVLKISIADDYQSLDRPEPASQNYQEAFDLAWSLQDYSLASQALEKLGELYQEYQQLDSALQIYQQLLRVEQKTYNFYGLMNTYDRLGQIYLTRQHYDRALVSFQKGLEIAKTLKYQESYFSSQIKQVEQQKNQ